MPIVKKALIVANMLKAMLLSLSPPFAGNLKHQASRCSYLDSKGSRRFPT